MILCYPVSCNSHLDLMLRVVRTIVNRRRNTVMRGDIGLVIARSLGCGAFLVNILSIRPEFYTNFPQFEIHKHCKYILQMRKYVWVMNSSTCVQTCFGITIVAGTEQFFHRHGRQAGGFTVTKLFISKII